jgi:hypothetical protein
MYYAIIGDMIDSKKLAERGKAQKLLEKTLGELNAAYGEDIAAKFTITLGDEFQGLLFRGEHCLSMVSKIMNAMDTEGIPLRFGIGIGGMGTDILSDRAIGADGPAYHHAREAIGAIRQIEAKKAEIVTNIRIRSEENGVADQTLNSIFSLCTFIRSKWTKRQAEIAKCVMECGNVQTKAATKLGITQSSVQKSLAASGYYSYTKALETAGRAVAAHWSEKKCLKPSCSCSF